MRLTISMLHPRLRLAARLALVAFLTGTAVVGFVTWRMLVIGERDMVAHLRDAPPMRVTDLGPGSAGTRSREVLLGDRHGSLRATIRYAPGPARRAPVVVVLGGLRTGRRAVDLVDPDLPFTVAGLDYAWHGPRRLSGLDLVLRLPAIQRDLARTAVALRDLVRLLERDPRAGGRTYLVGASLGAPIATSTAAAVRPAGLALLYGFADHEALLSYRLRPYVASPLLRDGLARAGAAFTANLDAARTLPRLCGTAVLVVSGSDDRDLPRECTDLLWSSTCEPRRKVELSGGHIRPRHETRLLQETTEAVTGWLMEMERGSWALTEPSQGANAAERQ